MPYENEAIVLAQRPKGEVQDADFRLERGPVRLLRAGEVLIKVLWLSLDPYMRPMMNGSKSYASPLQLGEVMRGESVGEVIESRSDLLSAGDLVTAHTGWQRFHIASPSDEVVRKVEACELPLSVFLGAAGMPGRTAYFGLNHLGKPKPGETVVVSAASGAVGSVVGQLAKHVGCKVVGIAGGAAKCAYVTDTLGFDVCLDYRRGNLAEELAAACPDGIDVYFENVGGAVTRAVAPLLNDGARVPICGYVASYNAEDPTKTETPFDVFGALAHPPEHRFFLVTEWDAEHAAATDALCSLIQAGRLKYHETVAEGLQNAVAGFRGMLRGENLGKQLVRVGVKED